MDKKFKKTIATFLITVLTLSSIALFWYSAIALKEQPIPADKIVASYAFQVPKNIEMFIEDIGGGQFSFSYKSFDGAMVNGQISYPPIDKASYPVLIGIAAMGRGYQRWWTDSFKGRPTVTRVNEITRVATEKGYVVIAIDARYHGKRKDPNKPVSSIMNDLHFFGNKTDYENMIRNTVLDYRVLIDWIRRQRRLDGNHLTLAGYSMGAQVALLTGALDQRVNRIIAIVPPHIDDKTAVVAPKNLAPLIKTPSVLLITASDDKYASKEENRKLYDAIASEEKEHLTFAGNHILPDNYVNALADRL